MAARREPDAGPSGQDAYPTIGLGLGLVDLVSYAPEWDRAFAAERDAIRATLGSLALDIQQVGGTAVPGSPATPVIDIAVAVARFEDGFACTQRLAPLCYAYVGDGGRARRHCFEKTDRSLRTHSLCLLEADGNDWRNAIRFGSFHSRW